MGAELWHGSRRIELPVARSSGLITVYELRGTAQWEMRFRLMDGLIHSDPSETDAEEGIVFIDGPDGVAIALTPEAAIETSDRLLYAAERARAQQIVAGKRKPNE